MTRLVSQILIIISMALLELGYGGKARGRPQHSLAGEISGRGHKYLRAVSETETKLTPPNPSSSNAMEILIKI